MAVRVQHSAIPLDCDGHKGEHRGKCANPAYVSAREQLAEDVSHFPLGVVESRSNDERNTNEQSYYYVSGC